MCRMMNIFKWIKDAFGVKIKPMLDEALIQEKLRVLNESETVDTNKTWRIDDSRNMFAVTLVKKQGEGLIFHPSYGIPIVVFANATTGELKMYDARNFGLII